MFGLEAKAPASPQALSLLCPVITRSHEAPSPPQAPPAPQQPKGQRRLRRLCRRPLLWLHGACPAASMKWTMARFSALPLSSQRQVSVNHSPFARSRRYPALHAVRAVPSPSQHLHSSRDIRQFPCHAPCRITPDSSIRPTSSAVWTSATWHEATACGCRSMPAPPALTSCAQLPRAPAGLQPRGREVW